MTLPLLNTVNSPNYSSRGGVPVRLIVVHDCEGSFNGSVSWFAQVESQVSAHVVLSDDGTRAVQMVSWANKAWHCKAFNAFSEGIEAAGYAAKGLGAPEWQALAEIVAFRLHARDLPPVWTRSGAGVGFCQHVDLGAAGGGHHDISSDSKVWQDFCAMVERAYAKPQPTVWGTQWSAAPPAPPAAWKPVGTVRHDLIEGSLEWVQMELNARKLVSIPLLVDGLDGPKTRSLIATFQGANGLFIDGIAGPKTIAALRK